MSVQLAQIEREVKSEVTFFVPATEDVDVLTTLYHFPTAITAGDYVKSLARHALRDEQCNRIPKILGLFWLNRADECGNFLLGEVEYSTRGYRATFGGRYLPNGSVRWQCYMD